MVRVIWIIDFAFIIVLPEMLLGFDEFSMRPLRIMGFTESLSTGAQMI